MGYTGTHIQNVEKLVIEVAVAVNELSVASFSYDFSERVNIHSRVVCMLTGSVRLVFLSVYPLLLISARSPLLPNQQMFSNPFRWRGRMGKLIARDDSKQSYVYTSSTYQFISIFLCILTKFIENVKRIISKKKGNVCAILKSKRGIAETFFYDKK